jgi:subtilisin family serine protease
VYVEFDRFSPQAVALVRAAGGKVHHQFPELSAVAATLPEPALDGLLRNPNVIAIERDPIRTPAAEVTPFGISMVQANQLPEPSPDGANNRTVCIIDSGVHRDHEDLPGGTNGSGTNNAGTGDWFVDRFGHGTHVGGTISALADNSKGVVGVLPSGVINLHIVKVFGDDGAWAYSSSLAAAGDVCVANGANVINMSLSGPLKSRFEEVKFNEFYNAGVLSVAAAGNQGTTQRRYPASYKNVISVAAIDDGKAVANFSQKNSQIELSGPGVQVLSTVPWKNTITVNGTVYSGNQIENAALGTANGTLVDGGLCTAEGGWSGNVVLCERGDNSFFEKVMNVQMSSGLATVIYNNATGNFLGTLGDGNSSDIPAISLSGEDGAVLATLVQNSQDPANEPASVVNSVKPGSGYEAWDGTSMATPHVVGVAALVWSHHLECDNVGIREVLQATAEDLGDAGRDNSYGFGLVQALDADTYITQNGCGAPGGDPGDPPVPCDELGQVGDPCNGPSDCCSNKCKGRSGFKTCK